ncbi:hypothetical protein CKQ16_19480 [Salmonella enterica subsp. enterica serovar Newport]|nr:hypothetical protein [Salmonella enterica subsp. enterica serovar Newport]
MVMMIRNRIFKLKTKRQDQLILFLFYWLHIVVQAVCIIVLVICTFMSVLRNTEEKTPLKFRMGTPFSHALKK